jgi:hypothetical protein
VVIKMDEPPKVSCKLNGTPCHKSRQLRNRSVGNLRCISCRYPSTRCRPRPSLLGTRRSSTPIREMHGHVGVTTTIRDLDRPQSTPWMPVSQLTLKLTEGAQAGEANSN